MHFVCSLGLKDTHEKGEKEAKTKTTVQCRFKAMSLALCEKTQSPHSVWGEELYLIQQGMTPGCMTQTSLPETDSTYLPHQNLKQPTVWALFSVWTSDKGAVFLSQYEKKQSYISNLEA